MSRVSNLYALLLVVAVPGQAFSQIPTTLLVDVLSPAPPITSTDIIQMRALTPDEVFPDTGHEIMSTVSIDDFAINWDITSQDADGVVLPVLTPMGTIVEVGPLAPGRYSVSADWNHVGPGLLIGAPSSGMGSTSFVVVPEPSAITTFALVAFLSPLFLWRFERSSANRSHLSR